jgi:multisubunit Na+/H+ antiporter MnhC subunit
MLIVWFIFRIIYDTGDTYFLKQVTIASTGGILLFYTMGFFSSFVLEIFQPNNKLYHKKYISPLFIALIIQFIIIFSLFFMFYNFIKRLRSDIFYITDVQGMYQRTGNYLSIIFILYSTIFYFVEISIIIVLIYFGK